MAKSKASTAPLPGIEGTGVSPVSIPEIDKAISKYEKKKDARCQASPGEIEAKREPTKLLHQNSSTLPLNGDGNRFYRFDDVDYVLEEKLKRRKVDDGSEQDED